MATSSVLYAAAKEIGTHCDPENRAFLQCKASNDDPALCLTSGNAVQACAIKVLKSAMATCGDAFQHYATCLDNQISEEYMFDRCRPAETTFADCRAAAASPANDPAAPLPDRSTLVAAAAAETGEASLHGNTKER